MSTFNLLKEHYEFFAFLFALISFLMIMGFRLALKAVKIDEFEKRIGELERINRIDYQEIKNAIIRIETILEMNKHK